MSRWNTYSCTCHISFFFQCQCQQPNAYTYTYVITKMYNALNTCQFSVVATFTYVLGKYHFTFPYLPSFVPCFSNLHLHIIPTTINYWPLKTQLQHQAIITKMYLWCIKYLSIMYYTCLFLCNSPTSFPFLLSSFLLIHV